MLFKTPVCSVRDVVAPSRGTPVALKHQQQTRINTLAILLLAAAWTPSASLAQECSENDLGCAAGRPCPLTGLPYEEFIAAPPATRGRADIPPVSERPFDPESGDKILVRRFIVEGVIPNPDFGITAETVQAAADAAFKALPGAESGQIRLTVGQMLKVPDEVTTFYRNKGYLVAKAFIPVQTVGSDAVVRLNVLEGKVSEVTVEGNKGYSANILRKPSHPLVGFTPIRDPVESALLYTQDYPGVRLFGTFRPGSQAGDTKLVLQVLEEDSFGFQAGVDNYGTEFTGLYRLRLDGAWKNPVGWGDEANLTLLQSVSPADTTYGSVGYRVPFGPRGFGVYTDLSQNSFSVEEGEFQQLKLAGTIDAYELGLDWRYKRFRFSNARVGLSYTAKQSELIALDTLVVADDKFNLVTLDSSLDRVDIRFRGVDQIQVKLRQGMSGEFANGNPSNLASSFSILGASYSRLQALGETQTAIFRLRAQMTEDRISPLEQFALAGPDSVRAYPVGQVLKAQGQFYSLEYQVQAPGFARKQGPFSRSWGDLLQLSLFGDYARGESAGTAKKDEDELAGAGVGVRFGVPGTFQFVLEGAKPLTSVVATDGNDLRFYGSLTMKF